ncbi:glycosyltransferase [Paenibacillus sp. Leaf72]|uniref:glycosyltransferase n=1 Tax=Paenibacillus sp. Leaf72 TaxID=1736234 RepID=UPI0006F34030|nr:glycosyltransferase [Paenibacillus sp. Leaf72]
MNILMFVSQLNTGGTEKYIHSVSRYLISKGFRIGVVTMGGPLLNSFKKAGITVHLLSPQKKSLVERISLLSLIISKGRYGLLHAHDSMSFRYAAILHRQYKIPLIATVHGTYHKQSALLATSKVAKHLIAVSPNLSNWLVRHMKISSNKILMIPNGIDTLTFNSISNKKKWRKALTLPLSAQILVYAGRFSSDKLPIAKKVILASEIVAKNNLNFVAVLFGPGSSVTRSKLEELAAKANRRLGRRAIYIRPPLPDIQHAYYAADVIVGTGRVALEAMACARPVIATGVAGYCGVVEPKNINEIIRVHFGDHGAIVSITVKKLSEDVNSILSRPRRARLLGEFGAKTVKDRFSIKKVGSQLIQAYMK